VDVDRERKLESIKEQIERGTYRVDPKAVADASVCRLLELARASQPGLSAEIAPGPFARN